MKYFWIKSSFCITLPSSEDFAAIIVITVTSWWARWHLKSPASPLFAQPFVRRRSKQTPKHRVTGLCEENPPVTGGFPHKGPVTRKTFPFDDVIMVTWVMASFHLRKVVSFVICIFFFWNYIYCNDIRIHFCGNVWLWNVTTGLQ